LTTRVGINKENFHKLCSSGLS